MPDKKRIIRLNHALPIPTVQEKVATLPVGIFAFSVKPQPGDTGLPMAILVIVEETEEGRTVYQFPMAADMVMQVARQLTDCAASLLEEPTANVPRKPAFPQMKRRLN